MRTAPPPSLFVAGHKNYSWTLFVLRAVGQSAYGVVGWGTCGAVARFAQEESQRAAARRSLLMLVLQCAFQNTIHVKIREPWEAERTRSATGSLVLAAFSTMAESESGKWFS